MNKETKLRIKQNIIYPFAFMLVPLPPLLLFSGKLLAQVQEFCNNNQSLCNQYQEADDRSPINLYEGIKNKMTLLILIQPVLSLSIGLSLATLNLMIKLTCKNTNDEHIQLIQQNQNSTKSCFDFFSNIRKNIVPTRAQARHITLNTVTLTFLSMLLSYHASATYRSLICNSESNTLCSMHFPNVTHVDAEKLSKFSDEVFQSQMSDNVPTGIGFAIVLLLFATTLSAYINYRNQPDNIEDNAESTFQL